MRSAPIAQKLREFSRAHAEIAGKRSIKPFYCTYCAAYARRVGAWREPNSDKLAAADAHDPKRLDGLPANLRFVEEGASREPLGVDSQPTRVGEHHDYSDDRADRSK